MDGRVPNFKRRSIGSTFSIEIQSFQNSDFEQMKRGTESLICRDLIPTSKQNESTWDAAKTKEV